jgi:probable HAF family extracellular repeat protein
VPNLLIVGVLVLGFALSGCGGGGGGSSSAPNTPPVNQAPNANAGADQTVDEGDTVNLSATGSDSDGNISSYSWQQESGTAVTITNADTANASFIAPDVTGPATLVFNVTVTDDDGATGSDTTTVTVNDLDPPPPPPSGDFIPLGDLVGGDFRSSATGVSDDGTVVVGNGTPASGGGAFRWTAATGLVALSGVPWGASPEQVSAEAVSADGATVVGWFQVETGGRIEAFHWNTATGAVGLGDLVGDQFQSESFGVSADGSVVVGTAVADGAEPGQGTRHLEAFRWTAATGMVGLGDIQGGDFRSDARGVSADGSVVVGWSSHASIDQEAFRWTSGTGMVGLGDIQGGDFRSDARGVSADGSVVVGSGSNATGSEAVLWTSAGGMIGLGDLAGGGFNSGASAVSADGSVVVGQSEVDASGFTVAFVWTQADGMQSLRDLLITKGVTGLDNWVLREATDISADGQWVVGNAINASGDDEAFLANISAP